MRYLIQARDQIFVKGYEFVSFIKNMGKNYNKNISENLTGNTITNVLIMLKNLQQMQ